MSKRSRVVIVGASIAGNTAAISLREEGFEGEIVLVGEENGKPYNRPPLSKEVLRTGRLEERHLLAGTEGLDVTRMPGMAATRLDSRSRSVLVGAFELSYDVLIVATGSRARKPEGTWSPNWHTLRTVDDAIELNRDLVRTGSLTVLGSGLLGCEAAMSSRPLATETTLLCRNRTFGVAGLGQLISDVVRKHLVANGVRILCGWSKLGERRGVDETDYRKARFDCAEDETLLMAVGDRPATDWLIGSGLVLSDGVVCNSSGVAGPSIYAVGDVARWSLPGSGPNVELPARVPHQLSAMEQARCVAARIVSGRRLPRTVPFYWSNLGDATLQVCGSVANADSATVAAGNVKSENLVVKYWRNGSPVGVAAWNSPHDFKQARREILMSSDDKSEEVL